MLYIFLHQKRSYLRIFCTISLPDLFCCHPQCYVQSLWLHSPLTTKMLHFTGLVAISAGGCYPEITSCLSPVEIVVALKLNKCVDQVDEKIAENRFYSSLQSCLILLLHYSWNLTFLLHILCQLVLWKRKGWVILRMCPFWSHLFPPGNRENICSTFWTSNFHNSELICKCKHFSSIVVTCFLLI